MEDEKEIYKKKAVALSFNDTLHDAPIVTSKGRGYIAQEIIKIADENKIPIYEDAKIVNILESLDIGDYVPRQLYVAVAEIICFALELEGNINK